MYWRMDECANVARRPSYWVVRAEARSRGGGSTLRSSSAGRDVFRGVGGEISAPDPQFSCRCRCRCSSPRASAPRGLRANQMATGPAHDLVSRNQQILPFPRDPQICVRAVAKHDEGERQIHDPRNADHAHGTFLGTTNPHAGAGQRRWESVWMRGQAELASPGVLIGKWSTGNDLRHHLWRGAPWPPSCFESRCPDGPRVHH